MFDEPKLVSLTAAARRLRVPVAWLRREAQAGRLPALGADGRLLFDITTIEPLVVGRAQAKPPEPPPAGGEGGSPCR